MSYPAHSLGGGLRYAVSVFYSPSWLDQWKKEWWVERNSGEWKEGGVNEEKRNCCGEGRGEKNERIIIRRKGWERSWGRCQKEMQRERVRERERERVRGSGKFL